MRDFQAGEGRPVPFKPGRPSGRLRRDESLLDVALPRLEILHAPLGLLTRQTHLVGHEVDALRAVELLVVWDAGGRLVDGVGALPLFFHVGCGLLAA